MITVTNSENGFHVGWLEGMYIDPEDGKIKLSIKLDPAVLMDIRPGFLPPPGMSVEFKPGGYVRINGRRK